MKVLIVKLSSLGDLIHTFPAITEFCQHNPQAEITWMVDSSLAYVPLWHPFVKKTMSVPLRGIKKNPWTWATFKKVVALWKALRHERYDLIIDLQGLYKSALLARLVRGKKIGLAKGSSRENVAWLYNQAIPVDWSHAAVLRSKELMAGASGYTVNPAIDYGHMQAWIPPIQQTILFAHGTTWPNKHYPDIFWRGLVELATAAGYEVLLPHSNPVELARASFLAINDRVKILPALSLNDLKEQIRVVSGVITVDTGLAYIAAMQSVPCVTLYGPTDPAKVSEASKNQVYLTADFPCAPCGARFCTHPDRKTDPTPPCFRTLPPQMVWDAFMKNRMIAS